MMRNQSSDVMFFSHAQNISASGIFFSSKAIDRIFGPEVDAERNLLLIRGAVPGATNSIVVVRPE